jgi:hypothetical protein
VPSSSLQRCETEKEKMRGTGRKFSPIHGSFNVTTGGSEGQRGVFCRKSDRRQLAVIVHSFASFGLRQAPHSPIQKNQAAAVERGDMNIGD